MKNENEPMSLIDIEKILIEAAKISNHRRFVIAGSLSIIGAVMVPPVDMSMSRDLDMYPQLDPGRGFLEIASSLGENSKFHLENGFYADPITPSLLILPENWENRLTQISLSHGVVAIFMDPNDVAIGKLVRGNKNDLEWVESGLIEGVMNSDTIMAIQDKSSNITHEESLELKSNLLKINSSKDYQTKRRGYTPG